jgi:hypothetical protein
MVHSNAQAFTTFVHATLTDLGDRFTRTRMWSPRAVFIAVLLLTRARRRTSYREMMNTFLADTAAFLKWDHRPSLSSLSAARKKVDLDACRTILRHLAARLESMTPKRFRHPSGRRFIGIDGLRLIAPPSRDTWRLLNEAKYHPWFASHCPQALTVVAVDLLRRLPLDFVLLPKGRGERAGAQQLAEQFHPGDVAVMDRGFPARWLLGEFLERGIDIVVRMTAATAGSWPEVTAFLSSGTLSATVDVRIDRTRTVRMRLIRRNFRRGRPRRGQKAETMVILTTLTAEDGFDREAITKLYAARWGIETVFREMKCEFEIERFHAKSVTGIQQEIAAVLAWIGFASAIQLIAETKLPKGRRVLRTLCFAEATKVMQAILAGGDLSAVLIEALENVCRYHYAPQSGRSYPRERKSPIGRFSVRAK